VNLLGDNIDTLKKNTETLIDASKEVGLEINVERKKYMLLSHQQNVGQNQDMKIADCLKMCHSSYIWGGH
jgi:ABC-type siderophore export system fused ATPase/permease subunit